MFKFQSKVVLKVCLLIETSNIFKIWAFSVEFLLHFNIWILIILWNTLPVWTVVQFFPRFCKCHWTFIIENLLKPVTKKVRLRKSRHANICSKNQFFRENVVVIAFSELRPGSDERYENSTFYGPFRFLIFILIFNKIL